MQGLGLTFDEFELITEGVFPPCLRDYLANSKTYRAAPPDARALTSARSLSIRCNTCSHNAFRCP